MSLMKHFLALEWTHQTSESHQFPSKSIQLMNTAIMERFITLPHIGNLFHFFSRQSALISLHQLIFYLIFEEHSRFNSSIMSLDQNHKRNHSGFFWSKKVNATISKQAEQTQCRKIAIWTSGAWTVTPSWMCCDAIMIHGCTADWSRQSWGNINTAMDV